MFDNTEKEGKTVGTSFMYYENGNVESIVDEEKGITMGFYEDGKISRFSKWLKDSVKCGDNSAFEQTKWYENGQLKSKYTYNCGKQLCKEYYNDTTLAVEKTIMGMSLFRVGNFTVWYPNHKLMIQGQYEDSETTSGANIKTGTWKYWNEKGQLLKEDYYRFGKLIKTKEFIKDKKALLEMNVN